MSKHFFGDYALNDIDDITKQKKQDLLKYNGMDAMATMYLLDEYLPRLEEENQSEIYNTLYKPAVYDLLTMQLVGLPINPVTVAETKVKLETDYNNALTKLRANSLVQDFTLQLRSKYVKDKNAKYKKKRITLEDVTDIEFNPKSGPQVSNLLYKFLGLPVLATSDSGAPSTDSDCLAELQAQNPSPKVKELLQCLIDFKAVEKIVSTFIPALSRDRDRVYGTYNMGTVVSGRLSASDSLQQMPSTGTKYAKAIKHCFEAPEGWVFVGIDYASLEDRISALLTKDKNKLLVYMKVQTYKVEVDGKVYYASDDDTIEIDGVQYPVTDFLKE